MAPTIVALAGLALLVLLAAAVAWQERRRPGERAIVYGVEESIAYIRRGLGERAAAALRAHDVRRILEWSVRYLQDPEVRRASGRPPVAAGVDAARYVQDHALASGHAYDGDLILEVLRLQASFLETLGALGSPVEDEAGPVDAEGEGRDRAGEPPA